MSYKDAIGYLYGLQKFGMKFGLDNMKRLMSASGEPHKAFRCIHVAGTNGKGSTSAMIEAILRTGGLRTGLFTSPHLVSFTERIRIDGREIAEQEVAALAHEVRLLAEGMDDFSPTFFEVVTTMAFLHFRKMGVEWAVVETGLGGRLDATNVVRPEVTVLTRIDYDHREFLGNTLREITSEKTGIIKQGVPVVSADQHPEAIAVIRKAAAEKSAPLFVYREDFSGEAVSGAPDALAGGLVFDYRGEASYKGLELPLAGVHQITNASVAARTAELVQRMLPEKRLDIAKGIAGVRWPGRLEMVSAEPPILIDGAHNPQAASTLAAHLQLLLASKYKRLILVLGIMGDKDAGGIAGPLLPLASEVIVTAPAYGRAARPEALAALISSLGYRTINAPDVSAALSLARDLFQEGDLIVITGSFYTIGEAVELIGKPGILTRLRESR